MRLLVVEDAEKLARTLKRGLEKEGYAVDTLGDGRLAQARLRSRADEYDLVLLDVMLPGVDGFTICRDLRERGLTVPVLMLTARDTTDDKVTGLDSGADDYLVKPFAFEELLARVRTLLRRPRGALPAALMAGDLVLDPVSRSARRGTTDLELTTKEFALLEFLMRHPGEVLSRERILDHVWDDEYDASSNVIDVHLKNLRRKVDGTDGPSLFRTVRGVGYCLRAPDPA
jgi:DNA-binding response OmpR family regulator